MPRSCNGLVLSTPAPCRSPFARNQTSQLVRFLSRPARGFLRRGANAVFLDGFAFRLFSTPSVLPRRRHPLFGASMHRILAVTLAALLVPVQPTPAPARAAS